MKLKTTLLTLLMIVFINKICFSQTTNCGNSNFEDTTFTNWTGGIGTCINYPTPTVWTVGFASNGINAPVTDPLARHTLLTNDTAFDPIAINAFTGLPEIPLVAPGGGHVSVRLGTSYVTGSLSPPPETEKLDYAIAVTPSNRFFTYQYAVVLQSATLGTHTYTQQPRFTVKVFDQFGVQISGPCGNYDIDGGTAATDTTFRPFDQPSGLTSGGGFYKTWTTVSIDLSAYIGTWVTIEFVTQDCTLGGHFGYAYIDASCSAQLQPSIAFCPNDTLLMLVAPPGFVSFQWYDGSGNLIPAGQGGNNDTLWVHNPVLGQVYTLSMFSASGCATSLTVTLSVSTMQIQHHSSATNCTGLNTGMAYVTTTGAVPPFFYVWHNITTGGNVVGSNNDSLINVPPGQYYVTINSAGGCAGTDTIIVANGCPNLGIGNIVNSSSITISPNPFTSQTTITFSGESRTSGTGSHTLLITDVLGNTIKQQTTNNQQLTIDLSDVSKGIYFVRITDEKKNVVNRKIVLQ